MDVERRAADQSWQGLTSPAGEETYPARLAPADRSPLCVALPVAAVGFGLALLTLLVGLDGSLAAAMATAGLLGLLWSLAIMRMETTVDFDGIEQRSLFGIRRLARTDVAGRWRIESTPRALLLIGRDGCFPMKVFNATEAALAGWVGALPELDLREADAAEDAFAARPELGSDPQARRTRVRRLRGFGWLLTCVAGAVSLIAIGREAPPVFVYAAAALPLIAIVLAWLLRGLDGPKEPLDTRWMISVTSVLILCGAGLGIRSTQLELWRPWIAVPAGFAFGLVPFWLAGRLDRSLLAGGPAALTGLLLLAAAGYGAGVLAQANILFDRTSPRAYRTEVVGKHYSGSRYRTPRVTLAPWGDRARPYEEEVSPELYPRLSLGQAICIVEHRGAFGWRWRHERPCPA